MSETGTKCFRECGSNMENSNLPEMEKMGHYHDDGDDDSDDDDDDDTMSVIKL